MRSPSDSLQQPQSTPVGLPRADRSHTAHGRHLDACVLPAVERGRAPEARAASDRPAGLVPFATSDTSSAVAAQKSRGIRYIPTTRQRREMRICRMRRASRTGARLLTQAAERGGFRVYPAMLTLTYRDNARWRRWQISDCLKRMRQWLERRGYRFRAVWVCELTAAGRPHYHVCLWIPAGVRFPKPDQQGWWPHGMTRIEEAKAPIAYITKYTSKGEDSFRLDESGEWIRNTFPKGARIHGRCGLEQLERRVVAWWCLPKYVRDHFAEVGSWVSRAEGGGWIERDTGDWIPSQVPL